MSVVSCLLLAKLMFQGKNKAAVRLFTKKLMGRVLHLVDQFNTNKRVRDVLHEEHPPSQPVYSDDPPEVYPVLFECMDASMN